MSVYLLLADDHLMVREGLKQVLELDHDIDVISEASDGYECLNLINKTHPDVVLLDINMPNLETPQSFPLNGPHACYHWNGSVKYPISETGSPPALRWLVSPAV